MKNRFITIVIILLKFSFKLIYICKQKNKGTLFNFFGSLWLDLSSS